MIDIKALQKKHSFTTLSSYKEEILVIPTGFPNIDYMTGIGGLPRGRYVELYGAESVGKSTFASYVVASAQKQGTVLWLDFEASTEVHRMTSLGVSASTLLFSRPKSMEEGFELARAISDTGSCSLIVMDSVGAMIPSSSLDRKPGDQKPGEHSRILSQCMPYLLGSMAQNQVCVLLINQTRSVIPSGVMTMVRETTPGGRAMKFYAHMRLRMRTLKTKKDGRADTQVYGSRLVNIRVEKSKVGQAYRETELDYYFDQGFDKLAALIRFLKDRGMIGRTGKIDEALTNGRPLRGTEAFLSELQSDPEVLALVSNYIRENTTPDIQ
jgi:recombination protein RecA